MRRKNPLPRLLLLLLLPLVSTGLQAQDAPSAADRANGIALARKLK